MKTPEQIAKEVDSSRYIEGYTNSRDIGGSGFRQAIAREAVRRDRAQQPQTFEQDGFSYEPFVQGRAIGYKVTDLRTDETAYFVVVPTHDGSRSGMSFMELDIKDSEEYERRIKDEPDTHLQMTDFAFPVTFRPILPDYLQEN